jgi:uncharacterized protein YdeI (YjbR/CyaY-like superfamily)
MQHLMIVFTLFVSSFLSSVTRSSGAFVARAQVPSHQRTLASMSKLEPPSGERNTKKKPKQITSSNLSNNWLAFCTASDLRNWLSQNHDKEKELQVRIFKKASGIPTVTWGECVVECLAWGWIDSRRNSLDADSYLQRITPRRQNSQWSQKNREHAEELIKQGRMMPRGLAAVNAAKKNKMWEAAYAGSADMTLPTDFLAALEGNPKANTFFKTLDRKNLFSIYCSLQSAKRPATRTKRMHNIIDQLARKEFFH